MKGWIFIIIIVGAIAYNFIGSRSSNEESESQTIIYQKGDYSSNKWYEGADGYETGLKVSEETQTPMLIYFRTDWCGYCAKFDSTLLPSPAVKSEFSRFVKVRINPDESDENRALKKLWKVGGYPTILLKDKPSANPKKSLRPFFKSGSTSVLHSEESFSRMLADLAN